LWSVKFTSRSSWIAKRGVFFVIWITHESCYGSELLKRQVTKLLSRTV